METWTPIPSCAGLYEASSLGRIRSTDRFVGHRWGGRALKKGQILTPQRDKNGYLQVNALRAGRLVTSKVHRLIAETFLGAADGREVNHKDLNKENNAVENLEWTSRRTNQQHAASHGRFTAMDNPRRAKRMTPQSVAELRAAREAGETFASLAERFGISTATAFRIAKGHIWK